jgi:hypothetical protein
VHTLDLSYVMTPDYVSGVNALGYVHTFIL